MPDHAVTGYVIWYFLVHWTGSDYGAPYGRFIPYDFLSGFFGGSAFLTAAWVLVRKHNCHEPRCPRLGRFPVEGTTWSACRRHHPEPPRRGDIRRRYHLYAGSKPGRG